MTSPASPLQLLLQFLALLLSKEQAATVFAEDPARVAFLLSCLDRPAPVPFYAAHCPPAPPSLHLPPWPATSTDDFRKIVTHIHTS